MLLWHDRVLLIMISLPREPLWEDGVVWLKERVVAMEGIRSVKDAALKTKFFFPVTVIWLGYKYGPLCIETVKIEDHP